MANLINNSGSWDSVQPELLEAAGAFLCLSLNDDEIQDKIDPAEYLDHYLEKLNSLSEIAEQLDYAGLLNACLVYQENIQALRIQETELSGEVLAALESWAELIIRYLQKPSDLDTAKDLINHLQLPVWSMPLPAEDAEMIEILLQGELKQTDAEIISHERDVVVEQAITLLDEVPEDTCTSTTDAQLPVLSENHESFSDNTLPSHIRELAEMLIEELPLMEEPLQKLFSINPEQEPAEWDSAIEVYSDYLNRFGEATGAVGFLGLQQVVSMLQENISLLGARRRVLSSEKQELLVEWSSHACLYLNAPYDTSTCEALVNWLKTTAWPIPLSEDEAAILLALLQSPDIPEPEIDEVASRPLLATADDVRIELPDDVNPELLTALLQELPDQTETFSRAIQNLIEGGSQEDVKIAQRMAHTLKGAANTVGVSGIPILTHHLEDILVALAQHETLPSRSLALSLMNAADCLEAMGETLCGIGDPPDNAQVVLQEILDWANHIDKEGLPTHEDHDTSPPTEIDSIGPSSITTPQSEVSKEPSRQNSSQTLKTSIATELVDELLRLGGETIILNSQVKEQARRIEERMKTMQTEFDRLQQLGGELERLIDIRDLSTDRQQLKISDFDSLEMDQYNELHTTSRMLVETATDARQVGDMVTTQLQQLDKMLLTQERLNLELQETVLSTRMVPINTVVPRLQRSVRQTCRLTGKQVELHISGSDTLLDSEVLNELIDPLMHVLRNAVDHGIETSADRSSSGKSATGNIWLEFLREGNNILVRCRDDGTGFDFKAIQITAEQRGILEPGQMVSEDELKNILLMPNFSTRSEVTQTSGRGVGLDVVYSHILSKGGSLSLKSNTGKGSTTEMRLPVSLISTHALLVRVQDQVVAVTDRGIEQILHSADGVLRELGDQQTLWVGEQTYPIKSLDQLLILGPDNRLEQRDPMPVLLVNTRTGTTAVQVEQILAGTDLVIKEFSRYVPRMPGIVGATILGDGSVTPVVDLAELMSEKHCQAGQVNAESGSDIQIASTTIAQPIALVADDSLSARKALIQVMEDAGYEVRAARDGMEAVQVIESIRPDIVLVDMEMPRMNGIELTAHIRAHPETSELPVIMITSRSTAKHRQQAEAVGVNVYLTKPFMDDELLDHVAALRG